MIPKLTQEQIEKANKNFEQQFGNLHQSFIHEGVKEGLVKNQEDIDLLSKYTSFIVFALKEQLREEQTV